MVVMAIALVLQVASWAVRAQETRVRDMKSRDAVFVTERACKGDAVLCAKEMWFNGDWHGVLLCRAGQCVKFESIFKEKP